MDSDLKKIENLAKENLELVELLIGYCINADNPKIDIEIVCNTLEKIKDSQKELINRIDKEDLKYFRNQMGI